MDDERDRESEPQKAIEEESQELLAERKEEQTDEELVEGYDPFYRVKELLERGDVTGAQARLDEFDERGAEWHYLQSLVYRKRNWLTESRKSLERAIDLDSENEEYKEALKRLDDMAENEQQQQKKKGKKPLGNRTSSGECAGMCGEGCAECCVMIACELACEGCSNC